ncbi:MAG: hypothetical protein AB8H79_01205 [Myxococcota bacterium]
MTEEMLANALGLACWVVFWAVLTATWAALAWRVCGRGAVFARVSAGSLWLILIAEILAWGSIIAGQALDAVNGNTAGGMTFSLIVVGALARGLPLVLVVLAAFVQALTTQEDGDGEGLDSV